MPAAWAVNKDDCIQIKDLLTSFMRWNVPGGHRTMHCILHGILLSLMFCYVFLLRWFSRMWHVECKVCDFCVYWTSHSFSGRANLPDSSWLSGSNRQAAYNDDMYSEPQLHHTACTMLPHSNVLCIYFPYNVPSDWWSHWWFVSLFRDHEESSLDHSRCHAWKSTSYTTITADNGVFLLDTEMQFHSLRIKLMISRSLLCFRDSLIFGPLYVVFLWGFNAFRGWKPPSVNKPSLWCAQCCFSLKTDVIIMALGLLC